MAAPRYCPSCLTSILRTAVRRTQSVISSPFHLQLRTAAQSANAQKYKRKDKPTSQRKKKSRTTFLQPDIKDAIQFSLVDAMR